MYFLAKDMPEGKTFKGQSKAEPMTVTSYKDLVQYLVWSFPLVGAMGVLVWRVSRITLSGSPLIAPALKYIIFAVLLIIYVAHVIKTLQVNLPGLKKGYAEKDKYHWGSVAALNSTYFANFGAELAVVSMLPMFFELTFRGLTNASGNLIMTATFSGLIASSFAFVNLIARPLGGLHFGPYDQTKKHNVDIYDWNCIRLPRNELYCKLRSR